MARSQNLPAALSRRAQRILRMADGEPNSAIAKRYRTSQPTVTWWRTRYRERGITGLHNDLKPGRPRSTSDGQVAELANTALQRTQPVLPMGLGYVEGITHDYIRHGTTTLFAALDVANGSILTQCKPQHRHQEFLSFLRHIEQSVPAHLDVHLICDNYSTHKHAKVKAWLARRPRFHLHFTPTYSSWLNQVERWFALITQQAIRRGSFDSVTELKRKINEFVEHYSQHPRPFKWTATAESILAKIERLCKVINGTQH